MKRRDRAEHTPALAYHIQVVAIYDLVRSHLRVRI